MMPHLFSHMPRAFSQLKSSCKAKRVGSKQVSQILLCDAIGIVVQDQHTQAGCGTTPNPA